jgi:hypothetical protein
VKRPLNERVQAFCFQDRVFDASIGESVVKIERVEVFDAHVMPLPITLIKPWLPKATRGLAIAGFDDQDIYNLLREATRNARRLVPDNEIRDPIATIRGTNRGRLNSSPEAPLAFRPVLSH